MTMAIRAVFHEPQYQITQFGITFASCISRQILSIRAQRRHPLNYLLPMVAHIIISLSPYRHEVKLENFEIVD